MLTLERFAEVRAEIERRADLDVVLRMERISRPEWRAIERHWLGELSASVSRGQLDLGERYLQAFFGGPSGPAPTEAPDAKRAVVTPSYLAARSAGPGSASGAGGTAPAVVAVAPAVVAAPAPLAPAPVAAPAAIRQAPPLEQRGTVLARGDAAKAATPFEADDAGLHGITLARYAELVCATQAPGGSGAAPGSAATAVLASFDLDEARHREVVAHFERRFAQRASLAMEFSRLVTRAQRERRDRQAGGAPAVISGGTPPAAPVVFASEPRIAVAAASVQSTVFLPEQPSRPTLAGDPVARYGQPLTPFGAGTATPPPPTAPIAQSGFTVAPGQSIPDGKPALPFASGGGASRPVDVDLSMMPLERYAELAVALASGEERASVLRRFVLTEPMWRSIAEAWGKEIASSPELRATFDRHIQNLRRR